MDEATFTFFVVGSFSLVSRVYWSSMGHLHTTFMRTSTLPPNDSIDNASALVRVITLHRRGDRSWPEPMLTHSLMHICFTRGQWVKLIFWSSMWHPMPSSLRWQYYRKGSPSPCRPLSFWFLGIMSCDGFFLPIVYLILTSHFPLPGRAGRQFFAPGLMRSIGDRQYNMSVRWKYIGAVSICTLCNLRRRGRWVSWFLKLHKSKDPFAFGQLWRISQIFMWRECAIYISQRYTGWPRPVNSCTCHGHHDNLSWRVSIVRGVWLVYEFQLWK